MLTLSIHIVKISEGEVHIYVGGFRPGTMPRIITEACTGARSTNGICEFQGKKNLAFSSNDL